VLRCDSRLATLRLIGATAALLSPPLPILAAWSKNPDPSGLEAFVGD